MSESNHSKIARWVRDTFKPGTVIILREFDKMDMDLGAQQEYESLVGKKGIVFDSRHSHLQVDFGSGHERVPLVPINDKVEIVSGPEETKFLKKRRVSDDEEGTTYYYHTSDT